MKELLISILLFVLIFIIGIFVAFLIGQSNLPDWVKFWLLS